MTTQLTLLSVTLVVAIVNILWASTSRLREVGVAYSAGSRDSESDIPIGLVTGRLQRAQRNLYETLPLFAAAILIAHVGGHDGSLSLYGAWAYTLSRIVYLPLYATGSNLRSPLWFVGLAGLLLVIIADLF